VLMMSTAVIERFEMLASPASERNKAPILEALRSRLPDSGTLLELASGSLQHALFMAPHFPALTWMPTEIDSRVLAEAGDFAAALGDRWPGNLQTTARLDVMAHPWQVAPVDVIYTANLLHISPFGATRGLFREAARVLTDTGRLLIYGPFRQAGEFRSEGDRQFDQSLRSRNSDWGIRDLEDLMRLANQSGLRLTETLAMPANNLLLRFDREG